MDELDKPTGCQEMLSTKGSTVETQTKDTQQSEKTTETGRTGENELQQDAMSDEGKQHGTLLDEESSLINPGSRARAQQQKKQNLQGNRNETGLPVENERPQLNRRDQEEGLLVENRQLRGELESLRSEYRSVKKRYQELKVRFRSERKVLRKYRRLLVSAFEADNLDAFRASTFEDWKSNSVPLDPFFDSGESKTYQNESDTVGIEKENGLDEPEWPVENQEEQKFSVSNDSSFEDVHNRKAKVQAVSAAEALGKGGDNMAAKASATAVVSIPEHDRKRSDVANDAKQRRREHQSKYVQNWVSENPSSVTEGKASDENEEEENVEENEQKYEGSRHSKYMMGKKMTDSLEPRRGRHSIWKPEEESLFDKGFSRYGPRWKLIQQNLLPQKSRQQIQSHGAYLLRQGRLPKEMYSGRHKRSFRDVERESQGKEDISYPKKASRQEQQDVNPVHYYDTITEDI